MARITIELSGERLTQLKELADRLKITLEGLINLSLERTLTTSDTAFEQAMKLVVSKNAELYSRLAK